MSIKDLTITDQNVQSVYVQSQPDRLTGTAQQNKAVFDALPQLIIQRFNLLLDALAGTGAAGEIPVGPIEGVTAENMQQALSAIQQNLTTYIDKIKSAVDASEVGVSPISGLEASKGCMLHCKGCCGLVAASYHKMVSERFQPQSLAFLLIS